MLANIPATQTVIEIKAPGARNITGQAYNVDGGFVPS